MNWLGNMPRNDSFWSGNCDNFIATFLVSDSVAAMSVVAAELPTISTRRTPTPYRNSALRIRRRNSRTRVTITAVMPKAYNATRRAGKRRVPMAYSQPITSKIPIKTPIKILDHSTRRRLYTPAEYRPRAAKIPIQIGVIRIKDTRYSWAYTSSSSGRWSSCTRTM